MTGMTIEVQPDRAVKVIAVAPLSPAWAGGLRADDVIESVDGRPFEPGDLAAFKQRMKTAGQEFRLGVVRDSSRSEAKFVTRRLI
jgi:C-terminal processing protease CtpA/Prc